MIGIRQKLMSGLGGLLAVMAVIAMLTVAQINDLGQAIDVILRENYQSVVTCQDMKEALERIDNGVLFHFLDSEVQGRRYIEENVKQFANSLDIEVGNITLPGEREKAERIRELFTEYVKAISSVTDMSVPVETRRAAYFSTLLPMFIEIKNLAQDILQMNQANMSEANDRARKQAKLAHQHILTAIVLSAVIAVLFSFLAQQWILKPVRRLIESANEIRCGNLDLVLETGSRDEIGQLSEAFNAMTERLRQVRRNEQIDLIRTRRATEEVFKALPMAIAVVNLDGRVEVSTETAERLFSLKPGILVQDLGCDWLSRLVLQALHESRIVEWNNGFIQQFSENKEYFFQPLVMPIPVNPNQGEPTGAAIILKDVTQVHEQQELKRGVVATVSHQLKTPLTSLRMSVHLLLDERLGALNDKQTELLVAAREESERLVSILEDLLDINRIESGKTLLEIQPISPHALARDTVEAFLFEARDKGITLVNAVSDDLPEVLADSARINHVLCNIVSNAIRFTSPGGTITIRAEGEPGFVRFLVEDTGTGILPEHQKHLFQQFYRVPGQDKKSGVGLGLAIVKEIVHAHGGTVGVESEAGRGSIFWFTLQQKEPLLSVNHCGDEKNL